MKNIKNTASISCCLLAALIMLDGFTVGCSKKTAARAESRAESITPDGAAVPLATTSAVASSVSSSASLNSPSVGDKISEANAAMKSHDYGKAAAALSAPLNSFGSMTGDQLVSYNNAKTALAQQASAAAAAGDPGAKAALEKMRQDALYHR